MSIDELIERFSLERVNPAPAVFDHQKLAWMNGAYLRELETGAYTAALAAHLADAASPLAGQARLGELVPRVQEKLGAFGEFDALAGSLLIDRDPDPVAWETLKADENAVPVLDAAITMLGAIAQFTPEAIEAALRSICDLLGLKPKNAFTPIRIAVTGSTVAPGLYESIAFLGRDASLARLQRARAAV
jgi:glutamyl-tRNA synthetase